MAMSSPDVFETIKGNVEQHFGVFVWPALVVAVGVVAWAVWIYRKEWREKHGPPLWQRKREKGKKQE